MTDDASELADVGSRRRARRSRLGNDHTASASVDATEAATRPAAQTPAGATGACSCWQPSRWWCLFRADSSANVCCCPVVPFGAPAGTHGTAARRRSRSALRRVGWCSGQGRRPPSPQVAQMRRGSPERPSALAAGGSSGAATAATAAGGGVSSPSRATSTPLAGTGSGGVRSNSAGSTSTSTGTSPAGASSPGGSSGAAASSASPSGGTSFPPGGSASAGTARPAPPRCHPVPAAQLPACQARGRPA